MFRSSFLLASLACHLPFISKTDLWSNNRPSGIMEASNLLQKREIYQHRILWPSHICQKQFSLNHRSLELAREPLPSVMLKNFLFHLRAVEADASQGEPGNCSEILPFQPFHISDASVFWCVAWSLNLCFSGKMKSIKTQELHLPQGAKSMEFLLHQLQQKKGKTWEQLPSGTAGELVYITYF